MSPRLQRFYGAHHLHFITCSCYRRKSLLREPRKRDRFLEIMEQVRQRYRFVVVGYVVMPEHIHLLISEPEVGTPSTLMQVVFYALDEAGPVRVNEGWGEISFRVALRAVVPNSVYSRP